MENISQNTIHFLKDCLNFLKKMENESERADSSPEKLSSAETDLFSSIGTLEGIRLKGFGLVASEFFDQFCKTLEELGLKISEGSTFKVSFNSLQYPLKTENIVGINNICAFISSLLSAYLMKPIDVKVNSEKNDSFTLHIAPSLKNGKTTQSNLSADLIHQLNNYLGGITSFTSLIELENGESEPTQQILNSVENIKKAIGNYHEFDKK